MLKPREILTIFLGIGTVIGCIWAGQNINLLPIAASANAPVYDELFKVLFTIGILLFVGMVGLVVYSLYKFRRKSGEEGDGLPIEGNLSLEIFWTAVPAIVVLFVGIYSYDIYDRMGGMQPLQHNMHMEAKGEASNEQFFGGIGAGPITSTQSTNALPIEVTAMQFAFLFHYPQGDIISGELHIPTGQPVEMRMESKDVIHAFWVPQFRLKQDVIPGQPTILNFTPTKAGNFPIVCAELCGPYHGGMRSNVIVDEQEDFDIWLKENSKETI